jgi:predicted  nucleic acid-binding Zn-ribbon protein
MEKKLQKIEETLNRLDNLHKTHMASFNREVLPDLEKQSVERAIEVKRLMKRISGLVQLAQTQTSATSESMMLSLNDRVTTLLEQNKALRTKVTASRDRIKNNLKQISKGKKVISSYRSSAAVSNNPRVLSITNY